MDKYLYTKLGGGMDHRKTFQNMYLLLFEVNMVVAMVTKFIKNLLFFLNGLTIVSHQYNKMAPGTKMMFLLERYTLWHNILDISSAVINVNGCHGNRIF